MSRDNLYKNLFRSLALIYIELSYKSTAVLDVEETCLIY